MTELAGSVSEGGKIDGACSGSWSTDGTDDVKASGTN